MQPVDQTRFAKGEGDCLSACIATITGVPLAQVPPFCVQMDDSEWYAEFGAWLNERGLYPLSLSFEDDGAIAQHFEWARLFGSAVPWIACGPTARGRHAVVYVGAALFHDPNPFDRSGLFKVQDATLLLRASVCV